MSECRNELIHKTAASHRLDASNKSWQLDDYAIVFAGGGAKGAWQIGVLQKLLEAKVIEKPAKVVAGTSVGALNAVLYAQSPDNIAYASDIWQNVLNDMDIKTYFGSTFMSDWYSASWFSNKGLKELINQGLSEQLKMETYVCAYNQTDKEIRSQELKKLDGNRDEQKKWLLASTAIPLVFPAVKIDGKLYSDGGFGWDTPLRGNSPMVKQMKNAPVDLVKSQFPSRILLLTLSQNETTFLTKENDAVIYPVMPSVDLGSPLDFKPDNINKLIELGKKDCSEWLERYHSSAVSEEYLQCRNAVEKIRVHIRTINEEVKEVRNLLSGNTPATESVSAFLKFVSEHKKNCTAIDSFIENYFLQDLPPLDMSELEDKENYLIQCFREWGKNDEHIKAWTESIEKHEHAVARSRFSLLSNAQHRKIIDGLPVERRECTLALLRNIQNIRDILSCNEFGVKQDKYIELERGVRELTDAIISYLNISNEPPLRELQAPNPGTKKFVGREEELKKLEENILGNPGKVVLLHGFWGNGKKEIAFRYAETHKSSYPGGVLYVDAAGKKSIADAILGELQANDEYKIPAEKKQWLSNKLRISGKVLIILYNVDDTTEAIFEEPDSSPVEKGIYNLLHNSERFSLIAVSNMEIYGDDNALVLQKIGPMSDSDGVKLLQLQCRELDNATALKICREAGFNPWALSLSGKICRKLGDRGQEDFSEQGLREEALPDVLFRAFIEKYVEPEFEKLSPGEKDILIYASLLPARFICGQWLSDLAGTPGIAKTLWGLYRKAWLGCADITQPPKKRWYWIHDNTRNALKKIISEEKRGEYGRKLCRFLKEEEWNDHIFSLQETNALAEAFLLWAKEPWKNDEDILGLLFSLSLEDDLGDYLTEYDLTVLRERVCLAAEKIVMDLPENSQKQKYRASLKIYQGHIDLGNGKNDEALLHYNEAWEIRKKIFGPEACETLLPCSYIASVYGLKGERCEAEKRFETCRENYEEYARKNRYGNKAKTAWETLARLYKRYGDFCCSLRNDEEAETYYRKAVCLALFTRKSDRNAKSRFLWAGNLYRALGLFYKKTRAYEKALKSFQKSNKLLGEGSSEEYLHANISWNRKEISEVKIALEENRNSL